MAASPKTPRQLRVASFGSSHAHFTFLGRRKSDSEGVIRKAVRMAEDHWRPKTVKTVDFVRVLGQSDLLVHLRLDDFRLVLQLQARLDEPRVHTSAWVFSVPYWPSYPRKSKRTVRFVIYLRVHRMIYSAYGETAERGIVQAIRRIIKTQKGIAAAVHYSLGWSDLLIDGSFDCELREFMLFVTRILGLHLRTPAGRAAGLGPLPVFRKSLTLLGLPSGRVVGPKVKPVILARSMPGSFTDEGGHLSRLLESAPELLGISGAFALDGKWDLIFSPSAEDESRPVGDFYERLRRSDDLFIKAGIETTETHLLFHEACELVDWTSAAGIEKLDLGDPPAGKLLERICSCSEETKALAELREKVDGEESLPKSLETTVLSMLSVFRYALLDGTNCCDCRSALTACASGLNKLLVYIDEARELVGKTENDQQVFWYEVLETFWTYSEQWALDAGRVLRERTAGSFDGLFGRVSSITSYRGSLQKILYIADNLLQEFYDRIDHALKSKDDQGFRFSTVYEPISTIKSERFSGIIKIPTRFAFSLHLVLPQLWHEAAQYVFHSFYDHPFSIRVDTLLQELSGKYEAKGVVIDERRREEFLANASDMFSDLLVLYYGFGNDYTSFGKYLSTLILDAFRYSRTPLSTQSVRIIELIRRLYFAKQFNVITNGLGSFELTGDARQNEVDRLLQDQARDWEATTYGVIHFVLGVCHFPRYAKDPGAVTQPGEGTLKDAFEAIQEMNYHGFYEAFLKDLVMTLHRAPPRPTRNARATRAWPELIRGLVVDFDAGAKMNDFYFELYQDEIESLLEVGPGETQAPRFRQMAALGRSAMLEFFKRQAAPTLPQ